MIRLVADVNIQGHIDRLVERMREEPWRDYWELLEVHCLTFQDLGLDASDSDAVVWQRCQDQQTLLLTNNRNDDGPDSLEATIRVRNNSQCLPVFTIGNADRMLVDRVYLDLAIDRLFRYLLELDGIGGTGRLYLP